MGAFKEEATIFETIAAKSERIYTDACDYGMTYNTNDIPKEIIDLKNAVQELKGTSLCKSYISDVFTTSTGIFEIAWEIDEGMECGTRYTVSCCRINPKSESLIKKGNNMAVCVDIENYRKPYKRS